MENEITIKLTLKELDVVMLGLMELQGKVMMPIAQKIDSQVRPQLPKEA